MRPAGDREGRLAIVALVAILLVQVIGPSLAAVTAEVPPSAVGTPPAPPTLSTLARPSDAQGRTSSLGLDVDWWSSGSFSGSMSSVWVEDIDGDGTEEILISVADSTHDAEPTGFMNLYAYDAATRALDWIAGPYQETWLADVRNLDSDPALELVLVQSCCLGRNSWITILDGATRTITFTSPAATGRGSSFWKLADSDLDGTIELLITNTSWNANASAGNGSFEDVIEIYDTTNGTREWQSEILPTVGKAVLADVDGDAALELVVWSWNSTATAPTDNISIFDGRTHALQQHIGLSDNVSARDPLLEVRDLTGDGQAEVVVNLAMDHYDMPDRLRAYRIDTGAELWTISQILGWPVIADVDDDGAVEVAYITPSLQLRIANGSTGVTEYTSELTGNLIAFGAGFDHDQDGLRDLLLVELTPGGERLDLLRPPGYAVDWASAVLGDEVEAPCCNLLGTPGRPGDWDADGAPDLLVSSRTYVIPGPPVDAVQVISAANGSVAWKVPSRDNASMGFLDSGILWPGGPDALLLLEKDSRVSTGNLTLVAAGAGKATWSSAGAQVATGRLIDLDSDGRLEILATTDEWSCPPACDGATQLLVGVLRPAIVQTAPLPEVVLPEDTDLPDALSLDAYFTAGTGSPLAFSITRNSDPTKVNATIVGDRLSVTTPAADWFGTVDLNLTVTAVGMPPLSGVPVRVNVTPVNDPPVLARIENQTILEGAAFALQLEATDVENDSILWATDDPRFPIEPASGRMSLVPGNDLVGSHRITVRVSDPSGANDSGTVTLTIENVNQPPRLQLFPANRTAFQGLELNIDFNAIDPDLPWGDVLTFTIAGLPGASLDSGRRTVNWTPTNADVGSAVLTITVHDQAWATDNVTVFITVLNANDPPTIAPVPDRSVNEDEPFVIRIAIDDPDRPYGDRVGLTVDPPWIASDPATGALRATPTQAEVGTRVVTVRATDSGDPPRFAVAQFRLTVVNVNDPPRIVDFDAPVNGSSLDAGHVVVRAAAIDEDPGDVLTYLWTESGTALARTNESTLVLAPGRHVVVLTVIDPAGATAHREAAFTVRASVTKVDQSNHLASVIALLFLLIAVVVLLLVAARRRKGLLLEDEYPEEAGSLAEDRPSDQGNRGGGIRARHGSGRSLEEDYAELLDTDEELPDHDPARVWSSSAGDDEPPGDPSEE